MELILRYTCAEEDGTRTVGDVMRNSYLMSRAQIKRLKDAPDGITVNGERVTVRRILSKGDELVLKITEKPAENIVMQKMPMSIIYEDEYIIAAEKPPFMPTHPTHGHYTGTLANGMAEYLNRKGEDCAIHIATRLDANTSGIVLFAKSAYVHDLLSQKLRKGLITKTYAALCEGVTDDRGSIEMPIARSDGSIITREVSADGAYACTDYKKICDNGTVSLVEIKPRTGRTHQIRVHMAYIGHPLVGDDMYGAKGSKGTRHMLHCTDLEFEHPITREPIKIHSSAPPDFNAESARETGREPSG